MYMLRNGPLSIVLQVTTRILINIACTGHRQEITYYLKSSAVNTKLMHEIRL